MKCAFCKKESKNLIERELDTGMSLSVLYAHDDCWILQDIIADNIIKYQLSKRLENNKRLMCLYAE